MEYGISTQNKFAFLGDDEEVTDPEEVLQRAEKESKEKPKTKDLKKPVAVPEKKVTVVAPTANKENVDARRGPPKRDNRGGGLLNRDQRSGGNKSGPRGPRRGGSTGDENAPPGDAMADRFGENRPPRNQNRRSKEGDNANRGGNRDGWQKSDRPPRQPRSGGENYISDSDGQQVNRGPRGDRPPRRGPRTGERGPARGDRQSGDPKSGARPGADKKGGYGAGNWGTGKDELVAETQPAATDDWNSSVPAADDWGTPAADNTQEATQDAGADANAEENQLNGADAEAQELSQMSLQEWKAQQKLNQPEFKVRKAGEGADQKIYQKLVPIKKEKVDKDAHTTEDEDEHEMKREPRERPLNIEISFNVPSRGGGRGGYREDRGPPRGDRPRGPPRSDRGPPRGDRPPRDAPTSSGGGGRRQNQGQGFNLTQESFPALGAR